MSFRILAVLCAAFLVACSSTSKDRDAEQSAPVEIDLSKDFPTPNSPLTQARIEKRIADIRYQRGVTLIANLERLANYGDVIIPFCIDGLENNDPMTRMGCAWVLGRLGNSAAVPALEGALDDEVPFVRYEIASQLGNLGSVKGYRVLVKGLRDERVEMRFKCFEALHELTGNTFGYSHTAAPEVRKVAVGEWDSWLGRMESEEL
ncbi:MAG: HEAT repeat domain-containing protein [Planctomycetota bacterium]|jgi:HEAT repeat protein